MPMARMSAFRATAAAAYPSQCVMLPQISAGQSGARVAAGRIGLASSPNLLKAWRAHSRPRVKSRLRVCETLPNAASSSGRSWPMRQPVNSATTAEPGTSEAMLKMPGIVHSNQRLLREGPASVGQRQLWLLEHYRMVGAAMNCPFVLRLEGSLDVERLRWALTQLIARHEALRTTVARRGR